ncbi:MAG: GLPGLI family protein [Winogradskyella sp.]
MRILIFFILITNNQMIISQSDEGRITYKTKTEVFKSEKNSKKSELYKALNKLSSIRDSVSLFLDFKNSESIFFVDEKTNIGLSNEKGYSSALNSFKTYYRNDEDKTCLMVINSDDIYQIKSKTTDIVWNITNETKEIGIYKCIKATANVKSKNPTKGEFIKIVEAWFCPEIPINLGPNNYGGLPGLIIELKEGKLTYYVRSINLNPDFDISVEKPKKGKVLTQQEYFDKIPTITKDNIREYIGN